MGMYVLLAAMAIYLLFYSVELLFLKLFKRSIEYVSWETWALFIGGQSAIVVIFIDVFSSININLLYEAVPMLLLLAILLIVTYMFHVEHEKVCTIGGRLEQCLSPLFVLTKSAEIVFQQLVYLVVVTKITLLPLLPIYGYALFIGIVLLLHLPLLVRVNQEYLKFFITGSVMVAVSAYYVYSTLDMIWPAIYVHAFLHVFYWIALSDMGLGKTKWRGG